jgi:adenosylcobinamide-GDP ribazoletransferase
MPARELATRPLRALLIAVAFLTRVPVRVGDVNTGELGNASACFPLVGIALGAFAWGFHRLAYPHLGASATALCVIAALALISGGLHLDGLADWFDALGGGRGDRDRMLAIMRDPAIGAHGASALILVMVGKVLAVADLRPGSAAVALLGAPATARCLAVWLLYALPPARVDGLARVLADEVRKQHVAFASAWIAALGACFGPRLAIGVLASVLVALPTAWLARARLGGVTGDVCGAIIETVELAFLLACRAT